MKPVTKDGRYTVVSTFVEKEVEHTRERSFIVKWEAMGYAAKLDALGREVEVYCPEGSCVYP